MKNKEEQDTYKDPVCGMVVSRLTAPSSCEHGGKTYYFCADACRDKFEAEPEKYTGKWPRKEV
jgi:Cu+-exporting ATPase